MTRSAAIATTSSRAYDPDDDYWARYAVAGAPQHKPRQDGWTPFRQQVFLRSLADGNTVELACAGVGLSVASAYAFRNRAGGAAFALGWAAARLLARERIADTLLTRALEGQIDTVTRPDGSTVDRFKYDNRLAMGLLTRLDRQAESNAAGAQAARLVAQEFEAFTDAIARDDSPARAGLFLGTRAVGEAEAELAPVIALARADRFARAGAGLPTEIDTADLDLAARADWTADQWQRADAAGLLAISPSPSGEGSGVGQFSDDGASSLQFPQLQLHEEGLEPVWNDQEYGLVTDFPPPDGFDGWSLGEWGDDEFMRALTPQECAAWSARSAEPDDDAAAEARARDARARDLFFGFATPSEDASHEPRLAAAPNDQPPKPQPVEASDCGDDRPPSAARRTPVDGGASPHPH